jgi:hypothetical protein
MNHYDWIHPASKPQEHSLLMGLHPCRWGGALEHHADGLLLLTIGRHDTNGIQLLPIPEGGMEAYTMNSASATN